MGWRVTYKQYQSEESLPKAADVHGDGTLAPRVSVWTPASRPLAVAPSVPLTGNWLAAASRTASAATSTIPLGNARGVNLILHVTAVPGVQTLSVQWYGGTFGNPFHLPAATITAIGDYLWSIYPAQGVTVVGNVKDRGAMAATANIQARIVHSGAGLWTYSVDYELLP